MKRVMTAMNPEVDSLGERRDVVVSLVIVDVRILGGVAVAARYNH